MAEKEIEVFGPIGNFPNPTANERLNALIGLDDKREVLAKSLSLLVSTDKLKEWQQKNYPLADSAIEYFFRRPPLVVLAGDVGTGKTELAETIGDAVARDMNIDVMLYPLTLSARGSGLVGEMTQLIDNAFSQVKEQAKSLKPNSGKAARGAIIMLIDEADALAQSREEAQMHHEDRAGVNALIRGIDNLSREKLPVAVIMNTNRLDALDPAIRRRAAEMLVFNRPDAAQRGEVLSVLLKHFELKDKDIASINAVFDKKSQAVTYSDLTQRFLPNLILASFPDGPVTVKKAIDVAERLEPTKPFGQTDA